MMNNENQPNQKIGDRGGDDESPERQNIPPIGDLNMRIARDGTWYYRGTPIRRMPLVKLFSTVLRREDDGTYWLVTPVERGRIEVEDVPFLAVELVAEGIGENAVLRFRTNLDHWFEAGADHPLRVAHDRETGEPSPYILVRDRLEARLSRSVYYHLVDLAVLARQDGTERLGIWSNGRFFPLDDPNAS
jgi:hypothetical protein